MLVINIHPPSGSQQTTTAQVAEFSDWMSTNGYNFTGATKSAALKNFVSNMVSTGPALSCIEQYRI